jgi:hypothetical protein
MEVFSLGTCMLEQGCSVKLYRTGILNRLTEKIIAVDRKGEIIDLYYNVASNNSFIAEWINTMSMHPESFESFIDIIPAEIPRNDIEIFLFMASIVNNESYLIIYSNSILDKKKFDWESPHTIIYNDTRIVVLDRKLALNALKEGSESPIEIYIDSIVAKEKSKIKNVRKNGKL